MSKVSISLAKVSDYKMIKNYMLKKPLFVKSLDKSNTQSLLVTGISPAKGLEKPLQLQISGTWVDYIDVLNTYEVENKDFSFFLE